MKIEENGNKGERTEMRKLKREGDGEIAYSSGEKSFKVQLLNIPDELEAPGQAGSCLRLYEGEASQGGQEEVQVSKEPDTEPEMALCISAVPGLSADFQLPGAVVFATLE